jgi:hypothetical protein
VAENDHTAQKHESAITFTDEYSNEEKKCPIVKVRYSSSEELNFEGKYVEAKKVGNEYWVYVYENTKSLKIFDTSRKTLPVVANFRDLGFSTLKEGTVYTLILDVQEVRDITSLSSSVTIGLGWYLPLSAPYFSLGYNYKGFGIEADISTGAFGSAESSVVYFKGEPYETIYGWQEGRVWGSTYSPLLQASLRLGYDIRLASRWALTPQIGATILVLDEESGWDGGLSDIPEGVKTLGEDETFVYDNDESEWTSIGGSVGARLMWTPFGNRFRLQVTPYYKFALKNSEVFEMLSDVNDDIKHWSNGFGITAGLLFYF